MPTYLAKLAKAALVFAAVSSGTVAFAQEEEVLTRAEVEDRIARVEAAIAEHRSKGEEEHVQGASKVLEQLHAALADFEQQGGAPVGEEEEENVFAILDQDQDGRISRQEFTQGFEEEPEGLWEQEDKNSDGFISFDEFGGPKGSRPPSGAGRDASASDNNANAGGQVNPSEVFHMMDTSGDNRISHEEFNVYFEDMGVEPNQALFRRDDQNKNGFIEFEEFGGNKGQGAQNLFAQLDVNGDNKLTREEFTVEWHTAPVSLFEKDDKNGDGVVSFDEFGGPKGLGNQPVQAEESAGNQESQEPQNVFALLDADQDGRISQEEFNADWHNAPEGLWESEDRNADGFISYEEFSGPKGEGQPSGQGDEQEEDDVFGMLDQNQDGRVSREEFVAGFNGDENEPEGLWEQEDANQDGYISWEEFGGPKSASPPSNSRREL